MVLSRFYSGCVAKQFDSVVDLYGPLGEYIAPVGPEIIHIDR